MAEEEKHSMVSGSIPASSHTPSMETSSSLPTRITWPRMLLQQDIITHEILHHTYPGSGTSSNPYLVTFFADDPRDPMNLPSWKRWTMCVVVGYITLSVAFISSAYASGIPEITVELGGNAEVNTLGLSLFVLGFVLGPFLWAPTSELFGRQHIFLLTSTTHFALNIGTCFSPNLPTLLTLRFLSGAFGAAPLTNAGGVIADTFAPKTRGLAMTIFALVPLFGPVLGPIVGGFAAQHAGWRWLTGVMALMSGSSLVAVAIAIPETYAPVLLRKRAAKLQRLTGKTYISATEARGGCAFSFTASLRTNLARPWLLAAFEPIIALLALYQAIVFGTLYLTFAAFPIVYAQGRGWSQGVAGLAFVGVMLGTLGGAAFQIWVNRRYVRLLGRTAPDLPPPEARLPACCVGSVAIPVGLFWFAWTNGPEVHWLVSVAAGVPFGFGVVLITIGTINYIVDSYTIYAASALTVCVCGRAVFGAVFPLFTRGMYANLGIHWASSVPAFLALVCVPFPFVFYSYGRRIRSRCRYAARAEEVLLQARRKVAEGQA